MSEPGASAAGSGPPMPEEDLEDLFENAPGGYVSARPNGRIIRVNQTLAAWLGRGLDELVGKRFQDLLNIAGKIYYETHFAPLLRMQGFFNEVAFDLVTKNGRALPVLVNAVERRDEAGQVRFIRITIFNASDRRRYERELLEARHVAEAASSAMRELNQTLEARIADAVEQRMKAEETLRQAQKIEAVGQLTGGIAHDFNNLLTGVIGSLDLLNTRIAQGRFQGVERYIGAARGAAWRAATLTHRLLAFARRQTLDPKPTDINGLVMGLEELVRRTMGQNIEIEVVSAAGLWNTLVDPSQLDNALLNLCINARDAMPEGGHLTVETANRWLDEAAAREIDLPAGQYVTLCVTDTGMGMEPEVIGRAFDPFFTTKPLGVGTGLGLSMIHGFARQSGGQVRIQSEVGKGTSVCLFLPRHDSSGVEAEAVVEVGGLASASAGEAVLVVDDEPTIRMLVTEVLNDAGYVALEAGDGAAALVALRSDVRIDLLVTDVALPGGMDGRQLADAARELRPGLRVLFITGYAENALIGKGQLAPDMHVMTKPFTMDALAVRIHNLLSQG